LCIAVATYYLRSLSQAVAAPPGASKAQKYRFLGNYFKDLPEDLDTLLLSLRHMVQGLEDVVAEGQKNKGGEGRRAAKATALAMCDEIRTKAALPEAMYQVGNNNVGVGHHSLVFAPAQCGLSLWVVRLAGHVFERQAPPPAVRPVRQGAQCSPSQNDLDAAASDVRKCGSGREWIFDTVCFEALRCAEFGCRAQEGHSRDFFSAKWLNAGPGAIRINFTLLVVSLVLCIHFARWQED